MKFKSHCFRKLTLLLIIISLGLFGWHYLTNKPHLVFADDVKGAVQSTISAAEVNDPPIENGIKHEEAIKSEVSANSVTKNPININVPSDNANDLQFFISEITDFYEFIITLLLGIIAAILAVSFIYLSSTSKLQAQEMATDALESKPFAIVLDNKISERMNRLKNEDEISVILAKIPKLEDRIRFIEIILNERNDDDDDNELHLTSDKD